MFSETPIWFMIVMGIVAMLCSSGFIWWGWDTKNKMSAAQLNTTFIWVVLIWCCCLILSNGIQLVRIAEAGEDEDEYEDEDEN